MCLEASKKQTGRVHTAPAFLVACKLVNFCPLHNYIIFVRASNQRQATLDIEEDAVGYLNCSGRHNDGEASEVMTLTGRVCRVCFDQ